MTVSDILVKCLSEFQKRVRPFLMVSFKLMLRYPETATASAACVLGEWKTLQVDDFARTSHLSTPHSPEDTRDPNITLI